MYLHILYRLFFMRITLIYRRFAIDNLLALLLHQFYWKSPHTLHIGYENYLKSNLIFCNFGIPMYNEEVFEFLIDNVLIIDEKQSWFFLNRENMSYVQDFKCDFLTDLDPLWSPINHFTVEFNCCSFIGSHLVFPIWEHCKHSI